MENVQELGQILMKYFEWHPKISGGVRDQLFKNHLCVPWIVAVG